MAVRAAVTRVEVDPDGQGKLTEIRRRVAKQVTDAVAVDARRLCPVDTGELLSSIDSRALVGRENDTPESDGGMVSVGTQYWDMLEYGGVEGAHAPGPYPPTIRTSGRHSTMDAQPFMRPALYTHRELEPVDL